MKRKGQQKPTLFSFHFSYSIKLTVWVPHRTSVVEGVVPVRHPAPRLPRLSNILLLFLLILRLLLLLLLLLVLLPFLLLLLFVHGDDDQGRVKTTEVRMKRLEPNNAMLKQICLIRRLVRKAVGAMRQAKHPPPPAWQDLLIHLPS